MEFKWKICPMCGPYIECPKCGNNTCSVGYGELKDGVPCDVCPSAYEYQKFNFPPKEIIHECRKMGIETSITSGDIIRHYKGGIYKVLMLSVHTETEETMISYQKNGDGNGIVWTRPAKMFYEEVEIDGDLVTRFEIIYSYD